MYRYSNGQISLSDFQQPMGMRLREDNRWVKKAQSIPWDKIEEKYADLFPSETGNVAKPLQLALGACLIQREYGYSDVETVLQIQENPYLQYFCGYAGYDDSKLPFDASSMVHFRKRLTPEVLAQINEMVIQEAQKTEDNDNQDDNKPDGGGNSGTIIVDATCAPSNIRYPQDVSLLNEASGAFTLDDEIQIHRRCLPGCLPCVTDSGERCWSASSISRPLRCAACRPQAARMPESVSHRCLILAVFRRFVMCGQ